MKKAKIIAGIVWAILCLLLIVALFPGLDSFSRSVSELSFMQIHPRYSGGEVAFRVVMENCTLEVRQPVFRGLVGNRKTGFVQIDRRGDIPELINDSIDYNQDGIMDFNVVIDTKSAETSINKFSDKVGNPVISTPVSYGWSVRVGLIR